MIPKPIPFALTEKQKQKFWNKVDRRGPNECWPWKAALAGGPTDPRGTMRVNKIQFPATRIGWLVVYGFDPHPLFVLHTCDFGLCYNPAHWFRGTHKENMSDMTSKGRTGRKINPEIVIAIRQRIREGESQQAIANSLGINQTLVSAIVRRVVWSHVSG